MPFTIKALANKEQKELSYNKSYRQSKPNTKPDGKNLKYTENF